MFFQPSKLSHPSDPNQSTNLPGWMKYLSLLIYFNGRAAAIATFIVSVGLGVLLAFEILPQGERWIVVCKLVGLYLGKNSGCWLVGPCEEERGRPSVPTWFHHVPLVCLMPWFFNHHHISFFWVRVLCGFQIESPETDMGRMGTGVLHRHFSASQVLPLVLATPSWVALSSDGFLGSLGYSAGWSREKEPVRLWPSVLPEQIRQANSSLVT